jgi:salicylate hydroxylase
LRARDTAAPKALLETLDERVSPAFAHDKRGGEDDSWIYAYDVRNIGAECGVDDARCAPHAANVKSRCAVGSLFATGCLWRKADIDIP